jgi:hypothetical protein
MRCAGGVTSASWRPEPDGPLRVDAAPPPAFDAHPSAARYARYLEDWLGVEPTGLAVQLVGEVGDDRLRLHPQLSGDVAAPVWSVRLDGLQIGMVGDREGWLGVGNDGKNGGLSRARTAWIALGGEVRPMPLTSARLGDAVRLLRAYVQRLSRPGRRVLDHGQPEHALESALLRGHLPVVVDGRVLTVPHARSAVVHASQIPAQWAHRTTSTRYVDALLGAGAVPWALELKIPSGGGGFGAYLRKGVAQAALYRHFLRSAAPMHAWMAAAGLDGTRTAAALVVPETAQPGAARQLENHERVAADLDVRVLTIREGQDGRPGQRTPSSADL